MTEARPLDVTRKDGMLVPKQRWLFDRLFAEGQEYTIEIHEPRSDKSHRHYFAVIREAWKNLPEDLSAQHPSPEHLRKWSLIKLGYSIKRNIVCETTEQRDAIAAMAGQLDENAVVLTQGLVVTVFTAKTQKTTGPGAMNRDDFQKSKQDVIDYVASLIGVDPATLSSQVSNSSDAHQANSDRTDTPAGSGPQNTPAGVSHSEASLLSDDWRDVYIVSLAGIRDKAASLLTRHAEAMQMLGGEPNESELAWMRRAWRLVQHRNEGKLKRGEYEAELENLKTMPLPAAQNAA